MENSLGLTYRGQFVVQKITLDLKDNFLHIISLVAPECQQHCFPRVSLTELGHGCRVFGLKAEIMILPPFNNGITERRTWSRLASC